MVWQRIIVNRVGNCIVNLALIPSTGLQAVFKVITLIESLNFEVTHIKCIRFDLKGLESVCVWASGEPTVNKDAQFLRR